MGVGVSQDVLTRDEVAYNRQQCDVQSQSGVGVGGGVQHTYVRTNSFETTAGGGI